MSTTSMKTNPVSHGSLSGGGARARKMLSSSGMIPALILLLIIGAILSPNFLTVTNLSNVLRLSAVLGLLAIGQTLVILSGGGGIDLSVANVAAASAVVGAMYQEYGTVVVVIVALLAGGFFGLINGLGVTTGGLQPFIITLATFTIARGVGYELTNAQPIFLNSTGLQSLATGSLAGVPVPIIILVVAIVVAQLVLSRTVYGRNLYAVGGNEEAAYASGINVRAYRIGVYVLSGLFAGLGGLLGMAQLNTADPNFGNGYELTAIAAVVVGGALLSGGKGSIIGTTIGVLIMALLSNLLNLLNVNPWTTLMITGLIVVLVVGLNREQSRGKANRLWNGAPVYIALGLGALLLYGFVK
jgi:ribose transport system permease protein